MEVTALATNDDLVNICEVILYLPKKCDNNCIESTNISVVSSGFQN